jgi:ubiquitin-activating enzyme E1
MLDNMNLDENLYSRQIAVYGKSAMKSLTNAKVLILGFDGTCLELCKNLILAGVSSINLIDSSIINIEDLATNYYATTDDIGKIAVEVIKNKLSELNPYVKFTVNNMDSQHKEHDVYIQINGSYENALTFNEKVRQLNKKFIWVNTYGLMGNVFCDFNNFVCKDVDGENPSLAVLQNITADGTFITIDSDPHELYVGDIFILEDVKGICDVNNQTFTVSKIINGTTFQVESKDINWNGYTSGGRIIQQKKEITFIHSLLDEQFDNPSIINLDTDATDLHDLFKQLHNNINNITSEYKYTKHFTSTLNGQFIPVCSILGSYAAQEVIKGITEKYTPTSQWYYYNCYDILDDTYNINYTLHGDRYDGMRMILGDENVNKIRGTSYFVVGSGAIGCEHMKNFSMCGIGSMDSQIYITDMDTIEKSNLNRQFLFRNSDIGKLKSDVAARETMIMNPTVVVSSHQNKVCSETESVYNTEFFNSIDGVANALDNVQARLYVDQRCIFNDKPLFESGTLGTKGNTQSIIPRVTEHYGASQDPQEKSFPVCTIKNFPNTIEHTIHWARNEFEELFTTHPHAWNKYLKDPSYLDRITANEKGEMINSILYLWRNRVSNFNDCVQFAINRFYEKYNNMIKQLLHAYPVDTETTSGINFWSGGKRCPVPIITIDCEYVKHTSLLIAEMFNINIEDINIEEILSNTISIYKPVDYIPSDDINISANDKEEKENEKAFNERANISLLPNILDLSKYNINSIDFEKDDDTNHHIDFITSSSNLRATNYEIPIADRYDTKIKAGKIIPAIATTTSMVSGLVTIEVIKYILGKRKIEDYKNTFLNLALGIIAQSEPMPAIINKVKDIELTVWDYYNIDSDILVSELLNKLSEKYCIEVDTISYGAKLLISPMTGPIQKNKRLGMKISKLLEEFDIGIENNIYEFQIGCLMEEEDYELPNIKFHYTKILKIENIVIDV